MSLLAFSVMLASGHGTAAATDSSSAPDPVRYRFQVVTAPELQVCVQSEFVAAEGGETTFEVSRDGAGSPPAARTSPTFGSSAGRERRCRSNTPSRIVGGFEARRESDSSSTTPSRPTSTRARLLRTCTGALS
jgi:hypothetical protein